MNNVALSFGLFEFLLTSIVFCIVTVAVARRFGRRVAWLWWAIAVVLELMRGSASLWNPDSQLVTIYMWATTWCVPTALAVWACVRAARVDPPGAVRHFARTYAAFIVGSIVGIALGAIPVYA